MPSRPLTARCVYELDRELKIRTLGDGWNDTAVEHGAGELTSPQPLGRPLLMYLSDVTTVHLYELLFERVRKTLRRVTFPIRCDGPTRRRYLDLSIEPGAAGGFLISTALVRSEARSPIVFLDRNAVRNRPPVVVCGWCQRVDVEGRWVEVEDAMTSLRLFELDHQPLITHGICHACHRFMLAMLAEDPTLNRSS